MSDLNQTIENAKKQLEQMIDLAPQAMLLIDDDGELARANRALLELVGADSFDTVLKKSLDEVFPGTIEVFPESAIGERGHSIRDAEVVLADGEKHLLQFTSIKAGGDSAMTVIMVGDITAERADAARLEKEHKKQAVGALAGAMLHHLGQPLTVILARAQLMNVAVEQGIMDPGEMSASLDEIIQLTQSIARTLQEIESPGDFVTCSYVGSKRILDLDGSRGNILSGVGFLEPVMASLECHSPGITGHGTRAADYAGILAGELGHSESDIEVARRCAFLHDVGKIGVPDSILQKPSDLSEEEMGAMRMHADSGYSLLSSIPSLTAEAEVAHSHHERYDGTGYPRGISGDRIDVRARIVAVADVLDVLHSGRAYHAGVPLDEAVANVSAGSGSQFDPAVIEALGNSTDRISKVV